MEKDLDNFGVFLKNITGLTNIYFQPPQNILIKYPCIIYSIVGYESLFAGNKKYKTDIKYSVKFITRERKADIINKILNITKCSYDREYIFDGLYHCIFTILYMEDFK